MAKDEAGKLLPKRYETWEDIGRYREMWGGIGRYREISVGKLPPKR
jgi:hypothetical protein